ncbi:hypothetical protein A2962_01160 [Candidatus Woesebacteria bacterium RIFCSPLOWO2_01_FULL_39_61]|uniref:Uncharacterized protein n=1 Tax=Candidatus Woesebacteria bacterium RIFCSPHIGHO2_02_FULL_39_13 TaxID=1802505 RepID=A0A1F7YZR2_9BACT|nr:MAG: hypothetical protein A2692_02035 [Candidatus Woesebacteria bacterium RIFCSPHIGHO2_01_FULL_39_95]OGM32369.1 MAG: hypothetical protein A3D01_04255 [Candidatus Woesebacteria bacterium RIFCSPHIGHO2_02_FULL_39_13]OGM37556.1 MAG: hypothetical protein A3E13_05105 [Candidatus Woesebacteria bacterium RIFCSPHIGHO2_12_FULL_40_20]OGM65643.1 MAG: hypothetical protein A2962_01160 [Candidatus Woesebacteria bacterium RIFCSPLOWO2_01_FULL_39_61]OGM73908.1 MAG: hypothetical protein A3H19_06260 [Candidatus
MSTILALIQAIGGVVVAGGYIARASRDYYGKQAVGEQGSPSTLLRTVDWLFLLFIGAIVVDGALQLALGHSVGALILSALLNPSG